MGRSLAGPGPVVPPALLPLVLGILLTVVAATTAAKAAAPVAKPTIYAYERSEHGVCPSMDIRSEPSYLERLRGCRVIEGSLSIVLMEKTKNDTFENLSFPELREITGNIQIYRMRGLRSIGDLFPNLAVVRGLTLFKDFAIVVYDNENLQTLGLRSLWRVERGGVRIERNDHLCYTTTIDWSRIMADGIENNIIRNNYDTRLCGLCPNADGRRLDRLSLQAQCPADNTGRLLCWDDKHCQKFCPSTCGDRACMSDGTCCDESCLGGCNGTTSKDCHVCRHFVLHPRGESEERICVDKCPQGTYELIRRCVTEEICRKTLAPRDAPDTYTQDNQRRHYKVLNNSCIYNCPSGYMEVGSAANSRCEKCPVDGCVRECDGGKIDTLTAAERFRGCTHIKGKVEISIRSTGGNTMAELEANLGEIREIEGALKVTRSHPLVSLSFLKSLRRIVGKSSPNETKKQTFFIFNNPNLELLWNWTTHGPIEIMQGTLFIHFNPKLCYNLITPLKNMTRDPQSTFEVLEVSEENNGDQASCLEDTLHLRVTLLHTRAVVLSWTMYCLQDARRLLGYSIYYTAAENNITQYERRDACYDSWNVIDVPNDELQNATKVEPTGTGPLSQSCNNLQPLFYPLTQLTPFTRYAAYVKTYTTLQDKSGAKSPIIYFKTLPGRPSQPLNIQVESIDAHTVFIRWSPPVMPNGTLAKYSVEIHKNEYNREQLLHIDHCNNPSAIQSLMPSRKDDSGSKKYSAGANSASGSDGTGSVKDDTCSCRDSSGSTRFTSEMEAEHAESIDFENALQNQVYKKNEPKRYGDSVRRVRRATDNSLVILSNSSDPVPRVKHPNRNDADGFVDTAYFETEGRTTRLTVSGLRHFTWYTVSVWACRQKHDNETEDAYEITWCSPRSFEHFRTMELSNADVVLNVRAELITSNKTGQEVHMSWDPPVRPNGFVVAYRVHHARVGDTPQAREQELQTCVSAGEYEAGGGGSVLRILAPGNYSLRVTPVTVGGPGNASDEIFVDIPERPGSGGWEWAWGVGGGAVAVLVALSVGGWYARRTIITAENKLFASVNPEYSSAVYVPDEWEVPRSDIDLIKELGQGSFGMVYEGLARNIVKGQSETRCAVKTVNEHATERERIEFLNEASVMKAFDTWHVVRLLGVVSQGQPTLVVMELMQRGDLKSYLRSHRPDNDDDHHQALTPPTLHQIYQMAIEIADGMAYLSAKKFVHRDLAARNCMVAEDMTVKVGDFGMTRDIYETDYYRKGSKGLLPVRWMSPESLKDGVFSSNSDVWSYGVVLWEMATLAMQPYQGLSNEQVLRYVVEGGVMERPEHCPDRLYELMRACWSHRPAARPAFLQLVANLAPTAATHFRHRSFFHTSQGQELYAQQRINMVRGVGDGCMFARSYRVKKPAPAAARLYDGKEEVETGSVSVGAVATGSGSNLFGVSGRLASWVRDLSSLRSRHEPDAAAEPLAPGRAMPLKPPSAHSPPPANGRIPPTTPC